MLIHCFVLLPEGCCKWCKQENYILKKNAARNKIRVDELEERVANLEKSICVVTKDEEALFVQLDNIGDFVELKTQINDSATRKKLVCVFI